jgi:hypothetical protein
MDYDFDVESNNMIRHYLKRGYPRRILVKHRENAKAFSQLDLLKPKEKVLTDREIMVTRYNPNNPDIIKILRKHWNIIQFSDDCTNSFSHNPMLGLRKQPNLNNLLCRANITYSPQATPKNKGYKPALCHRLAKCKYCQKLYNEKSMLFITSTHKEFKSVYMPNAKIVRCELSNIIYCIMCKVCKLQYIGETGRPIRHRIYEHLYSITRTDAKETPAGI